MTNNDDIRAAMEAVQPPKPPKPPKPQPPKPSAPPPPPMVAEALAFIERQTAELERS
jgi:hypothetical protein